MNLQKTDSSEPPDDGIFDRDPWHSQVVRNVVEVGLAFLRCAVTTRIDLYAMSGLHGSETDQNCKNVFHLRGDQAPVTTKLNNATDIRVCRILVGKCDLGSVYQCYRFVDHPVFAQEGAFRVEEKMVAGCLVQDRRDLAFQIRRHGEARRFCTLVLDGDTMDCPTKTNGIIGVRNVQIDMVHSDVRSHKWSGREK